MQVGTSTNGYYQSSASSKDSGPSASMDYDAFLQLLVAELKNQDPTNPMDPTESVAQFAAFASVEQSMQTNSKLEAMLTSSALAQADGVIGRTVTSADGKTSGKVVSVTIGDGGSVTAKLDTGKTLPLGSGTVVS